MRRLMIAVIALVGIGGCRQTPAVRDITYFETKLPEKKNPGAEPAPDLAAIKPGVDIRFSANPVPPSPVLPRREGYYRTWPYDVTVNVDTGATIDRWGVLERDGFRWKHSSFSQADFAEAFNCPKGILEPGRTYTYETAHEIGVMPGKVKWYFIAVDAEGKRKKGEAIVESATLNN